MLDKFLNLFVLNPVEDFLPKTDKKVSKNVSFLIRLLCWGLMLIIYVDTSKLGQSLFDNLMMIMIAEIAWLGLEKSDNAEELIAHVLASSAFIVMEHMVRNGEVTSNLFLILFVLDRFMIKDLLAKEKIDHQKIQEWYLYRERNCKYLFTMMVIVQIFFQKFIAPWIF